MKITSENERWFVTARLHRWGLWGAAFYVGAGPLTLCIVAGKYASDNSWLHVGWWTGLGGRRLRFHLIMMQGWKLRYSADSKNGGLR